MRLDEWLALVKRLEEEVPAELSESVQEAVRLRLLSVRLLVQSRRAVQDGNVWLVESGDAE